MFDWISIASNAGERIGLETRIARGPAGRRTVRRRKIVTEPGDVSRRDGKTLAEKNPVKLSARQDFHNDVFSRFRCGQINVNNAVLAESNYQLDTRVH